ncbi:MAG: hypothetical protein J5I50_03900 [Chitinophagaceae bacterium]|nr:hypothetical protein [Chitinophagaceae bacterium]
MQSYLSPGIVIFLIPVTAAFLLIWLLTKKKSFLKMAIGLWVVVLLVSMLYNLYHNLKEREKQRKQMHQNTTETTYIRTHQKIEVTSYYFGANSYLRLSNCSMNFLES